MCLPGEANDPRVPDAATGPALARVRVATTATPRNGKEPHTT